MIQALYDRNDIRSNSFRRYIREYNACNAFTSLGAKFDTTVLTGRGPNSFIIHGELRHKIGSLLPQSDQEPSYAQLYIYDPDTALQERHHRNSHLRMDVLKSILETLQQYNPFPTKYRHAYELLT